MKKSTTAFGLATFVAALLAGCETTTEPLAVAVATEAADPVEPVAAIDPRARVSMINPGSKIPDHVSEPVGPTAPIHAYTGSLEPRKMYLVEADPEKGFQWPYLLLLPEEIASGSSVLIQPNNDSLIGAPFETHVYWPRWSTNRRLSTSGAISARRS